jgi:hypothetical protein
MAKAVATVVAIAQAVQGFLTEVGAPVDLTPEEVAGHKGKHDDVIAAQQGEAVAQSAQDSDSVKVRSTWKDVWDLCDSIEDIAVAKAQTEGARQAIVKLRAVGGFTLARARVRGNALQGALTQFPVGFTALGKTQPQLLAEVGQGFAVDQVHSAITAALKSAQTTLRVAANALGQENDRVLKILRGSYRKGSPERDTLDRALRAAQPRSAPQKKPGQPEDRPA